MNLTALTSPEDNVEQLLAAETVRGPRAFRGRPLAPPSRGLRQLREKVTLRGDTGAFFDALWLHILAEAHRADPAGAALARAQLIAATDDATGFRAVVNVAMDDFTDADVAEAERLVTELLALEQKAKTELVPDPKKNGDGATAGTHPTPTPSPSTPSPALLDGASPSSAGS